MTRLLDVIFSLMALFSLLPILAPVSITLLHTGEVKAFCRPERFTKERKFLNLLNLSKIDQRLVGIQKGGITPSGLRFF